MELTYPPLKLLHELCRACEASQYCSHWFITVRDGKTIPCHASGIEHMNVPFDIPPEPRTTEDSNANDLRGDIRKLMKVRQVALRGHITELMGCIADEIEQG